VRLILGTNPSDGTKITEHYSIERVNSSVNNLIFGEMYVEHSGTMTVRNKSLNEVCFVDFKKRGWGNKGAFEVEGFAYNQNNMKEKKGRISGKWTESLAIRIYNGTEQQQQDQVIWTANPMPPQSDSMYYFTYFTLQLNYLPPSLRSKLPPTDSRLRPDQRALENGDLVRAADEK